MEGHAGISGLQAHSLGTVYPFGVVSKGDEMFYSVDYRRCMVKELTRLPFPSFKKAFKVSMLRRVADLLGPDAGSITFSVSPYRAAGEEIIIEDVDDCEYWQQVDVLQPITHEHLGFLLASRVSSGLAYHIESHGDGDYTLYEEVETIG